MSTHTSYTISFQTVGAPAEGFLSIMESPVNVPFDIKRTFVTHGTPTTIRRGGHAHHDTEMILIAVQGTITVCTEDRFGHEQEVTLGSPSKGLYLPTLCWHTMQYSPGAIQLVLASTLYLKEDYIRSYERYVQECQKYRL